jgi:glycosyltransferase involved in cell wall biosynthesis
LDQKIRLKILLFNKDKVIHIYNPYLKKINKKNYRYKKDVVLFVGRFVKQKGIIYLLKAFSIISK